MIDIEHPGRHTLATSSLETFARAFQRGDRMASTSMLRRIELAAWRKGPIVTRGHMKARLSIPWHRCRTRVRTAHPTLKWPQMQEGTALAVTYGSVFDPCVHQATNRLVHKIDTVVRLIDDHDG